jgi:hypothetical protein
MPSKQKYVDVCKNNSEKARTFIFPTHASADLTNPDELASCRIILLFLHACMHVPDVKSCYVWPLVHFSPGMCNWESD